MTRILPIIMLTIGLVLLSSSFATAATTEAGAEFSEQWCVLEDRATADIASSFDRPEPKLGRCWKELALGIVVPGCKVHLQLPQAWAVAPEQPVAQRASMPPPMALTGIEPVLDLPPPKA